MDKNLLLENIIQCCRARDEPPTGACINAGVGRSFLSNIRAGQTPSVAKVAALAAYLGVTTSDLVGDTRTSPEENELSHLCARLNAEGRKHLWEYAELLAGNEKYTERPPRQSGE